MNHAVQNATLAWTHIAEQLSKLAQPWTSGAKQANAALVPGEALSEQEQVVQRYQQCPKVAQRCLQLMAGLLVANFT